MKQLNGIIASPLVELVNKTFQSGIFLIFSKLLRSFQSLKVSHEGQGWQFSQNLYGMNIP